jgi:hypothetical protein
MKNIKHILLAASLAGAVAQAAPSMAIGDNAELFLTGSLALRFDDNIYLDGTNERDDTIISFTPGAEVVFGQGSATKGKIYLREEFRKYSDNSNQDDELVSVGVNSLYDGGKSKFDFAASFAQVAQNDNDRRVTGDIVRRDVTHIHALPEFGFSEKSSLAIGARYDRTAYDTTGYADLSVWELPLDLYYQTTEKLAWSVGYRYRSSDLSGAGTDSTDNFLNIGARGEFTPKLTGQVRVGFNQRDLDRGGDSNDIGVDARVTYAASEKSNYTFTIGNDFGSSGQGESLEKFTLGFIASNKLDEQWALNTNLTYTSTDYPARSEDYFDGQFGISYTYNQNVNFDASLTYRDNSSSRGGGDFTNTIWSFGASVRY